MCQNRALTYNTTKVLDLMELKWQYGNKIITMVNEI